MSCSPGSTAGDLQKLQLRMHLRWSMRSEAGGGDFVWFPYKLGKEVKDESRRGAWETPISSSTSDAIYASPSLNLRLPLELPSSTASQTKH